MRLPHETGFIAADYPYTESEFLKICEDYGVPNDPMRYRDEKFYWSYKRGVGWPNDYLGPDSMTQWIIETSVGFTDVGLLIAFVNCFGTGSGRLFCNMEYLSLKCMDHPLIITLTICQLV